MKMTLRWGYEPLWETTFDPMAKCICREGLSSQALWVYGDVPQVARRRTWRFENYPRTTWEVYHGRLGN